MTALFPPTALSLGVAARLVPLPSGADPGPEDGPGDDLLAGARRPGPTSTRPRSAAISRASASSASGASATTSTRWSPRSARSCRTSGQHNIALFGAWQPRSGDRLLGHLRRPRLSHRRDLRQRPPKLAGKEFGGVPVRPIEELDKVVAQGGDRRRRPRRPGRIRPGRRRSAGRGPVLADHLQLLRAAARRCCWRSRSIPRARQSTCSTRSTSTSRRTSSRRTRMTAAGDHGLDLDLARECFLSSSPRTSPFGARGGVRDRRPGDARARAFDSSELLRGLAGSIRSWPSPSRGELIDTEIEIRLGRSESYTERGSNAQQECRAEACSRLPAAIGVTRRLDGHPSRAVGQGSA